VLTSEPQSWENHGPEESQHHWRPPDSEEEAEMGLAEWTKKKELTSCPFDVTKADRIFDLLLQERQIKLCANHTIPSAVELKNRKYCKWHNSVSQILVNVGSSAGRSKRLSSKEGSRC